MEKATAVNTCLGVLKGRDCIYLDQVKQDALNNLTFTGDINGHLISQCRDEKDWFPYTLTFRQVLAYFTCELDTYENMAGTEYLDGSSFDLIEDSTWLKSLPVREDFDKGIYRHYRLFTYDDVYKILLYGKSIASSPVPLHSYTIDAQSSNIILRSCAFLSFYVAIIHLPKKMLIFH